MADEHRSDQLSWETLLAQADAEKPRPVTSSAAEEFKSNPVSIPVSIPAPTPAPTPSQSIAAHSKTQHSGEFSSMNWAPLTTSVPVVAEAASALERASEPLSVRLPLAKMPDAVPAAVTKSRRSPKPARTAKALSSETDLEAVDPEQPEVMTVSALNRAIKDALEGQFSPVWLKAEISNFKAHTSGHFYFSLKDAKCQISAVMFRGFNASLRFKPEDGMEVIVRGKVTVYEPRGNYQIFCEMMEPVGAGALQKAFEQLKAKLQAEGLFDAARKRALPTLPQHIAIVTSPTGAAIRDMLNVLGRRFKGARVTLIPAKVQGDQAPAEIVAAIAAVNLLSDVDVLIVGRGGGSIEDLWAFNDERVVRAIAAARVPTISAVGHEIDFTIADFVADLRAPTPSAAAELVVRNAADLSEHLAKLAQRLALASRRTLQGLKQRLDSGTRGLVDPQRRLQDLSLRCDELAQRLEASAFRTVQDLRLRVELLREKVGSPVQRLARERQAIAAFESRLKAAVCNLTERRRQQWLRQAGLLDTLSPLRVVERGYAIATLSGQVGGQAGGQVVKDVASLAPGAGVRLQFARGAALARIEKIENEMKVGAERD